ncbi:uncharacterized protein FOMMEDRAFT_152434 [Fomitiporia mediterranea MF3/22]|uniref:uncharacterized protein n=1 Tax=Fomitiporia mediterranea (strain MF3/22) TaxID=694068 RepID=UPI0004408C66|nr:uncharacterized protein FOMMEDRAFT_152434 [Fomitiporia mediterranea MF3/22]EJD07082.1 hypothetical protein FOMMEDRAFT_152434 [Fomitiporia mediterranea MF3/22]
MNVRYDGVRRAAMLILGVPTLFNSAPNAPRTYERGDYTCTAGAWNAVASVIGTCPNWLLPLISRAHALALVHLCFILFVIIYAHVSYALHLSAPQTPANHHASALKRLYSWSAIRQQR